jgi:hypothetical protein
VREPRIVQNAQSRKRSRKYWPPLRVHIVKTDVQGCSTYPTGSEQYEEFWSGDRRNRTPRVQYDYRHGNGKLFSTIAPTLEEARRRRDAWLAKNGWSQ